MPSRVSSEDSEIYKRIGRRIQELRTGQKLTQENISENTGLSAKYVGFIEQGRKRPRVHVLAGIARSLNCDIKDLF